MPEADGFLAGYRPERGSADELVDDQGRVRPHWRPVLDELRRPKAEVEARFAAADRHLTNSGVFYRVYDDRGGGERAWPLSHVPLVLDREDWRRIERGIIQRAGLMEMILEDLYGPARLVTEGAIPATVIAGNPHFLRPLAGTKPRGGEHLVLYAADLARAPDGRWWVLGDRAQAPSGMGYALENRLALSGALPALYRDMHVRRLAPFFQAMRSALAGKAAREGARIGLLTPGPANETYFAHTYLARYLGFLLVEGGDLIVQDGALHVRTIEGLKRLDVVMRRLDADFCDPIELNAESRIGVPGLVEAVRKGSVALANALGAGLVEASALLAFLPAIARRLLGEDLVLPNVATWWCGDASVRAEVLSRLDTVHLDAAFARRPPGLSRDGLTAPAGDEAERRRLARIVETHPLDVVAQETVRFSTMPVWRDGRLVPRPFTLRVFAVSTPNGWTVMPGGFCRVSDSADPGALSMQRGGRSADVWVPSDGPVEPVTLLPRGGKVAIRRRLGHLTSRAADNLFWLGRYLERAEATLRLIRALAEISVETDQDDAEAAGRLAGLLVAWDAAEPGGVDTVLREALTGKRSGSAAVLVGQAQRTVAVIRERVSPDATRALEDLTALIAANGASPREIADRALRVVAAFSGLAQENMNRISGWRLLELGRRIERAILTCRMARILGEEAAREASLDALLKVVDSRITYRSRYLMGTLRPPVLDLVILDDGNPRSVAFQIDRMVEHLATLPRGTEDGTVDPVHRRARLLQTRIETSEARDLDGAAILALETELLDFATDIAAQFFGNAPAADDSLGDLG
ncbi:MAG: circularly permuted type 2 ATP-grasp protein [Labrys sp. (in: a-proteobacteria)]